MILVAISLVLLSLCGLSTADTFQSTCPNAPKTAVAGFTGGKQCSFGKHYYYQSTVAVASETACGSLCIADTACAGFNYNGGTNSCELFNTTSSSTPATNANYNAYERNTCTVTDPPHGSSKVPGTSGVCYVGTCTVKYTCKSGYNLVGSNSAKCDTTTSMLKPSRPTCALITTAAPSSSSFAASSSSFAASSSSMAPGGSSSSMDGTATALGSSVASGGCSDAWWLCGYWVVALAGLLGIIGLLAGVSCFNYCANQKLQQQLQNSVVDYGSDTRIKK